MSDGGYKKTERFDLQNLKWPVHSFETLFQPKCLSTFILETSNITYIEDEVILWQFCTLFLDCGAPSKHSLFLIYFCCPFDIVLVYSIKVERFLILFFWWSGYKINLPFLTNCFCSQKAIFSNMWPITWLKTVSLSPSHLNVWQTRDTPY